MKLYVIAVQSTKELSEAEDEDVEGVYLMDVTDGLTSEKAASAALDIFHSNIPVSALDDFQFFVTDGQRLLEEDEHHESYSKAEAGSLHTRIYTQIPEMNPDRETIAKWVGLNYQKKYDSETSEAKDKWLKRYRETQIQALGL